MLRTWAPYVVVSLVAVFSGAIPAYAQSRMTAHFIDVGQADATLLEFSRGAILSDAGSRDYAHATAEQSPALMLVAQSDKTSEPSDDEIRNLMIRTSIARYPGPCACPFNRASDGSRCGRRSAYSKPGGYSPLCYGADVSERMIEDYRRMHTE